MHVCMYVCMNEWMNEWMIKSMYEWIYVCMNIYILIWVWSGQELNAMFNICHLNQIKVVDVAQKLSLFHKITNDKIMITWMGLCTTMCQLSTCPVMRARCFQQGFVSFAYIQTGSCARFHAWLLHEWIYLLWCLNTCHRLATMQGQSRQTKHMPEIMHVNISIYTWMSPCACFKSEPLCDPLFHLANPWCCSQRFVTMARSWHCVRN